MKQKTRAVCTELCRRVLCGPILIHEFFSYPEPSYSENHSVWRVMTSYKKENQTLQNEIEELKNKLQKVSDDLSKSQIGWQAKRVN